MTTQGEAELTRLLEGVNAGHAGAVDELSAAIHDHLRAMARRHLVRDFGPGMAGVTIQPRKAIFGLPETALRSGLAGFDARKMSSRNALM